MLWLSNHHRKNLDPSHGNLRDDASQSPGRPFSSSRQPSIKHQICKAPGSGHRLGTVQLQRASQGLVASPNMQQFGQLNRPTLPAFAMVMIKSWLVMPHWNKWNYLIHGVCEVHTSIGLWTSCNGKQSCPWLTRMSKPTKWVDFWHPQKQWHHQPHSSTQTPQKSRFRWEPRVSLKNSARHACCHQTHYTNGQRQTKSPHLLGLGNHWGLSVSM